MKDKLVSVIIPVYKTEEYLERCLNSVLMQSYKNLEVILVDDGSPDRSGELCELYTQQDSRINVIHKKNGGLSSARNVGLDVAKGRYLTFIDSDDCIHPEMLKWMVAQIERSNSDMVTTGLECFKTKFPSNIETRYEVKFKIMDKNSFIDHLYPHNFEEISVTACGKLYKATIFNDLRYPEGVVHEDLRIFLDVLMRCNRISVSEQAMYYYYINPNSIMHGNYLEYDRFGEFIVRESYIGFFEKKGLIDQTMWALNDYLTFFMRNYYAVFLRYPERKKDFIPHVKIFRKHLKQIMSDPFVCRMRKVCAKMMLTFPKISFQIARKCIPDCLLEEMR